jgi:hypothetical protein
MKYSTLLTSFFFLILIAGCDSAVSSEEVEINAPILLVPANGSETADAVLLDWDDVSGATEYVVQVSRNQEFTDLVDESRVLDRSEYIIRRLTKQTVLYWRTKAKSKNGVEGRWSTVYSFKPVRQAFFPSYPEQSFPINGSKNHERSVMLRWEPVAEALSYHLVVTIDEDMLLFQVDLEDLKSTSFFAEGLVLTYPYWWKVRSLNAAGYSDWSPVWIFEIKFNED